SKSRIEPAANVIDPTSSDSMLAPGARCPPLLTVTAPEIMPVPPRVLPELTTTELVPVPLPLVLLINSLPSLIVVMPEYVLPARRPSVNVPEPTFVKLPALLNKPLNVVELPFPPVVSVVISGDVKLIFPPDEPPPESEPTVSDPLIVRATPAVLAKVIA